MADEKSGIHGQWKTYVESQGLKVDFLPFRHNRFNIIFLLGGVCYYHKDHLLHFLEYVHGVTNNLLEQIVSDAKEELYVSGARALGLISKQITAPLWRLIESKTHILEMNEWYLDLCNFLTEMQDSTAVSAFLYGEKMPFVSPVDDEIHKALVKPASNDSLTADIL